MKNFIALVFLALLSSFIYDVNISTNNVKVNHHELKTGINLISPIKIAFISDLHITDNMSDFERMLVIEKQLGEFSPDIILFGGDFTGLNSQETNIIKDKIVNALKPFASIAPTYSVLGNHEWWTSNKWDLWLTESGIETIDGKQINLNIRNKQICLRGLGDAFTDHYQSIPFNLNCRGIKITLTHDPYAIEQENEEGLYFAGHTHCGQIRIPFIHPIWAPTNASEKYVCGFGFDKDKIWLVSEGVGTSVVPVRIGTQSSIEFILLK